MDETEFRRCELERSFGRCPVCSGSFVAHDVATIAMTVARSETAPQTEQFIQSLEDHRWPEVKHHQEFEGAYNAIIARVLRFVDGSLILLLVRDPVELFDSSTVLAYEILSPEAGRDLDSEITPDQWSRL